MVKISRNGNGFKVQFAEPGTGMRGFSVQAVNVDEAANAVKHYYGGEKNGEHNPNCPVCRSRPKECYECGKTIKKPKLPANEAEAHPKCRKG